MIGSTHTHAGPDLQGLWGGVPEIYRERILGLIVDSMVAAWNQREPAALQVGADTADNRNRRGWEFTDDVLFTLQARALDDDELLGTTVAFAAHPVVLDDDNLLVSRDWCGYAVDDLEQATGAPVLYFNGVQGDVSPDVPDGDYADDFERAEAYGVHVSGQAQAALASLTPVSDDFHHGYRSFELDITNDLFILAAMGGILDYEFDLDPAVVTTQVAYIRLGTELQLIAFPGESLTRNGLPIREAMTTSHGAILGPERRRARLLRPGRRVDDRPQRRLRGVGLGRRASRRSDPGDHPGADGRGRLLVWRVWGTSEARSPQST